MKKKILVPLLLVLLLMPSCMSTEAYVDGYASRQDLTVEEKLFHYGGVQIDVGTPECYFDGSAVLARMTELVEGAEDYILISTFLGSYSDELDGLYGALAEKAESGVDVYFMMDGISSLDMTESRNHMTPLYFLRESGVHLLEYSPMSFMRVLNPAELLVRDHRKLFVVDGRISGIGGMNLNYISIGSGEKNQRDSFYFFDSSALSKALATEFIKNWNDSSVEKLSLEDFSFAADDGSGHIKAYLFNQTHGGDVDISGMFSSLINSAEKSISILPYLPVLDGNMREALVAAIERGVEVEMVVPMESRGYAEAGVRYLLPKLTETGADVYVSVLGPDQPMLHEKLMVVDGRYSVIGSTNFNYRSMALAHEISMVLDDEELASFFLSHIEDRKAEGVVELDHETAEAWSKDGGSWLSYLMIYFGG